MTGNIRILAAMLYAVLIVLTVLIDESRVGIVAVIGAIVLGAVYVLTRKRAAPRGNRSR
jgi:hypothetical protein